MITKQFLMIGAVIIFLALALGGLPTGEIASTIIAPSSIECGSGYVDILMEDVTTTGGIDTTSFQHDSAVLRSSSCYAQWQRDFLGKDTAPTVQSATWGNYDIAKYMAGFTDNVPLSSSKMSGYNPYGPWCLIPENQGKPQCRGDTPVKTYLSAQGELDTPSNTKKLLVKLRFRLESSTPTNDEGFIDDGVWDGPTQDDVGDTGMVVDVIFDEKDKPPPPANVFSMMIAWFQNMFNWILGGFA